MLEASKFNFLAFFRLKLAQASSIKSIALSGKRLSVKYLVLRETAESIAASEIRTLWKTSKCDLIPFKIWVDSLSVGSQTIIFWNLRSKAASFSMLFLYSSKVVAPIICIWDLERAGFKIFAASIAPSAPPAPIIMWSSSIKSITSRIFLHSSAIFLTRSSNSPRYLVPAITELKSSETIFLSLREFGTSPLAILIARPSTKAVLPTPASPIIAGLFFLRLHKMQIRLSISFSRPTTGSISLQCAR